VLVPVLLNARRIVGCDLMDRLKLLGQLSSNLAFTANGVIRSTYLVLASRAMAHQVHVPIV
jgi:hypothetical protein